MGVDEAGESILPNRARAEPAEIEFCFLCKLIMISKFFPCKDWVVEDLHTYRYVVNHPLFYI